MLEMPSESKPPIAILMGSDSDWETLQHTEQTLTGFDLRCEVRVMSAHRTPEAVAEFAREAEGRGVKVLIAAAGGAAHLAGVVAAHTTLPVIGVPVKGWALDGLDSLLSTVQMPGGIPVATVAIGKAGAVNAAILAVQILALHDTALRRRLKEHKASLKDKVVDGDRRVQSLRKKQP
jgi:5-(carboxyamino)imidazole ribonucleotide mutase